MHPKRIIFLLIERQQEPYRGILLIYLNHVIHRLPGMHKLVHDKGKHIACDEQHELMIHTDAFEVQLYVRLLHGSRREQRMPGAQ